MLRSGRRTGFSKKLRRQTANGPRWSFLDGPITANNPMGVHHAWGRSLKDMYQRYHAMNGESCGIRTASTARDFGWKLKSKESSACKLKREIRDFRH